MTTYSNDQANLLLGKAATLEAYNDVPLRGTTTNDGRVLAPRVTGDNPRLSPGEWNCGDQSWLIGNRSVRRGRGGSEGTQGQGLRRSTADDGAAGG